MRTFGFCAAAVAGIALHAPRPAPAAPAKVVLARITAEHGTHASMPAFRQAREALTRLAAQEAGLQVNWAATRLRPAVLRGMTLAVAGDSLAARARGFFAAYTGLVTGEQEMLALLEKRRSRDRAVLRFGQRYRGVPVLDREVRVAFDDLGRIRAIHADAEPVALTSVRPLLSAGAALRNAYRAVTADPRAVLPPPLASNTAKLAILAEGTARLVFTVVFPASVDPRGRIHLVDARDGSYIGWRPGVLFDPLPRQEVRR
jgi:hypothetical protein